MSLSTAPGATRREKGTVYIEPAYDCNTSVAQTIDLSRLSYWDTRFSTLQGLYDKVKFHKLAIRFIPALGATSPGNISMYLDPDPLDLHNTLNLSEMMDNQSAKRGHITNEFSVLLPGPTRKLYTCPRISEWRLSSPGNFYYLIHGSGLAAYTQVGTFVMDYDCTLYHPSSGTAGWRTNTDFDHCEAITGNYNFVTKAISSSNVAELQMQNAGSVAETIPQGTIVSARTRMSGASTGTFRCDATDVPFGSRLIFEPASAQHDDAADTLTELGNTAITGIVKDITGRVLRGVINNGNAAFLTGALQAILN